MPSADPAPPRRICTADEPALESFLASIWDAVPWRERFAAQWTRNPFAAGAGRGYLCEERGEITACFGSIPMPYRVPGRDVIGLGATALAVRQDRRGSGLARALVRAWLAEDGADVWINATPNEPSRQLFEQLGFRAACDEGEAAPRRAWLERRPLASAYRGLRERLGMARVLAPLGAPFAWLRARARRRSQRDLASAARRAERDEAIRVERLACSDPRLDELWFRVRDAPCIQRRGDAASLQWAFESGAHADRNVLLGLEQAGELLAWIALRAEPERGTLRLVDEIGLPREPERFAVLACAATEELLRLGLERLELRGDEELAAALRTFDLGSEAVRDGALWTARDAEAPPLLLGPLDGDRILDVLL